MQESPSPKGDLILRTMAMPPDTNPDGDIFGGWIMSQMDIAGGIIAKERAGSRVVTVAVESLQFIRPVRVGDIICTYGRIRKEGTTSVTVSLEVWVRPKVKPPQTEGEIQQVTKAAFTYVAVDQQGKSQPLQARL